MTGNKSKKRIAIVGSAGVGKTTLLDALFSTVIASDNEAIPSTYTKIPEAVRVLCGERGYKSPYDVPADDTHKFREDILDRQIEAENAAESFIADRSVLDSWAYYMRWSWNTTMVEDAERFCQKVMTQAKQYDLLIYLPIMFEVKDDGFRWKNDVYQKQIDRLLLSVIRDAGLEDKVFTVTELDLEARVSQVGSLVSS